MTTSAVSINSAEARYTLRKKLRPHLPHKPQVWFARDRRLGCDVVLKKYIGDELAPIWKAEVELLALNLPRLPRLFDAVSLPGDTCFLTREYIPGALLSNQLVPPTSDDDKARTIHRIINLAARIARLAHALHSAKPRAVSLPPLTKLADFLVCGEAQGNSGSPCDLKLLPTVTAEEPFTSPADIRGDIGRLGIMTLEMLGDYEARFRHAQPALLLQIVELLARATHLDPDQRHGSALWLAQDLEAAAEQLSAGTVSQSILAELTTKRAVDVETRLVSAEDTLSCRRLQEGQFSSQIALASAAHDLRELISVGDDPERLIALDTLECDHYPHQLETVRQVVSRPEMVSGAILSDEVGLGKTVEALLICQELRARGLAKSVLIVTSPSGAAQWLAECRRRIRTEQHGGAAEFHLYAAERDLHRSLLIVSSATLRRADFLERLVQSRRDDVVIVDEAHQCCSATASAAALSPFGQAVSRLHRKRLLLLTATPITASLMQLGTLANFIQPGAVDGIDASVKGGDANADAAKTRVLRTRMQALLVRHRRSDLAQSLPAPELIVRRIDTPAPCVAAKVRIAADFICGEWRQERVVAFCRSLEARLALAAELRRQMPERVAIQFQGGRREQRAQESQFAEYANAVMIAGDKTAEGMNWQRSRRLIHLDVPLTPIVWEQRVGRIVRLGQRAPRLEIVLLAASAGERRALDLYENALGLFTLSVGEAANVLDHAPGLSAFSIERSIQSLLSGRAFSDTRYAALAAALKHARSTYDRQTLENQWFDEIFSDESPASLPLAESRDELSEPEWFRQYRFEQCIHTVVDAVAAERRETSPGSGIWLAHLGDFAPQFPPLRKPTGRADAVGDAILLYTFESSRWESGSRLQCCAMQSALARRLCAWALASCPVVQAYWGDSNDCEPHLAAAFSARLDGATSRETIQWLAISLRTGHVKPLSKNPLHTTRLLPGAPPASNKPVPPQVLVHALQLLAARFNEEAQIMLEAQRDAKQRQLDQLLKTLSTSISANPKARIAAEIRSAENAKLSLETSLIGAALLWTPA